MRTPRVQSSCAKFSMKLIIPPLPLQIALYMSLFCQQLGEVKPSTKAHAAALLLALNADLRSGMCLLHLAQAYPRFKFSARNA
ncbi:hypothetical protein BG58_03830 [Caballeronia jiangsuensis]|nr:hypothetical protein BG58_03830 [Caballeronia jiangsuensis]